MKINLYTCYYLDDSEERQKEIDFCLDQNSKVFDKVFIFKDDLKRPTFNDFFNKIEEKNDSINIISNSDIYFIKSEIEKMYSYLDDDVCLALTRWDILKNEEPKLFDRMDSQDTWVFKGKVKIRLAEDFPMGIPGCDNRLAHELEKKYNVLNPSRNIKTYHLHLSNKRNYYESDGSVKNRISPPYKFLEPTL